MLDIEGLSVTNKLIKKVSNGEKLNMVPSEPIKPLKGDVEAEKSQLVDRRRELEEEHERKKAELKEEPERKKAELEAIQKDIESKREKIR